MALNGLYIGTVEDNNDPLKLGKLKVRVPSIYGNIPTEDLPWSEPCFPYSYNDQGFFFIPEIGAFVTIMFLNNSSYRPIWMGAIHRTDENIPPQVAMENYPDRKVIKTETGYYLHDDTDDFIEVKHKNGSYILMESEGDVIIHSARDIILISDRYILENP